MTAGAYLSTLPFPPDRFQLDACRALDRGESVLVTAPTGSGKTVVAEAAVARALGRGERALYTTPLKALSNQKYAEMRSRHGDAGVGLLTGDNSINGRAPVVVMTTEVLRNMMYAASPDLDDVGVVVLDEIHYLQDPERGAVWEEIIVHLDRSIPLVGLSATVANPEDFADWMRDRRGATALVVERERPVPLESTYLVRDRWEGGGLRLVPVFQGDDGRANPKLVRMLRPPPRRPGRDGRDGAGRRYVSPRRYETAVELQRRGMLPAIYFIFSRRGCEAAAAAVVERGLRLTGRSEVQAIREAAEDRTAHLSRRDLDVLGYGRWVHALEAGVAAHHAGLVPAFKETTEKLFERGLVKLVFATETLALGINMPARTVVLEQLSKFTGEGHELLQPGDYTQLTGRAGRRGIDEAGTAVVLHSPYVPIERVAGIAAAGSHPLRSSFRPTYNMAVNLVARYPQRRAEELLDASFAQFDVRRRRAGLEADLAEDHARLEAARAEAACDHGDVWAELDGVAPGRDRIMAEFAASTSAGDVLEWHDRGKLRRHVVVARGRGKRPRLLCVSDEGELRRIAPDRFPDGIVRLGTIELQRPFRPRDAAYRHRLAAGLSGWVPDREPDGPVALPAEPRPCPDWGHHLAAARDVRRIEARIEATRRRLTASGTGLVPRLRAILELLERWGYADGWTLTESGERLRTIYNDLDLLLAEAVGSGVLNDLDPPSLAAIVSAFTFTPRGGAEGGVWPTSEVADRAALLDGLWERLTADERRYRLPETRSPEPGFAEIAYRWSGGAELDDLFDGDTAEVGDFVRNCRQLIDLLLQIRDGSRDLAAAAVSAARSVDRGVVAASGAV